MSTDGGFDPLVVLIPVAIIWVLSGFVAAEEAPKHRRLEFLVLTLVFLGPMGVGFAAVAPPRPRRAPEGRRTYTCLRCDTRQHIGSTAMHFECWRCELPMRVNVGAFGRHHLSAAMAGARPTDPEK